MHEFRECLRSEREENENKKAKHLKATLATLAINSAKCEHGFRTMNTILTEQ